MNQAVSTNSSRDDVPEECLKDPPKKHFSKENSISDKLNSLQGEVVSINSKLSSVLYTLILKEQENELLKLRLKELEKSPSENKRCPCSANCLIF